jgi:DNA-directed RNA polymerase subunit RPC12/RpoP
MTREWADDVACPACGESLYLDTRDFDKKDVDKWDELTTRCECGVKLWIQARVQFFVEAKV